MAVDPTYVGRWARPSVKWLVAGASLLVPLCVAVTRHNPEPWFKYHGLLLQLVGFGLVWKDLTSALRQFGSPTLFERFVKWAKSFGPQPRQVIAQMTANIEALASVEARARYGPGGTPETRMLALEKNLEALESQVGAIAKRIEADKTWASERIDKETEALRRKIEEVAERVRDVSVGGFDSDAIGLVFFVVGMVLTTVPHELAALVGCVRG